MIVNEFIRHLKAYRFINILFLILFLIISLFIFINKKDDLVSATNVYARSDLFYSEIVNYNKKQILSNLFSTYDDSGDQNINKQYSETLLHIRKIDVEGEVVTDFETIMKTKALIPLFLGYLKDRVEFINFLEKNANSAELIDKIGKNLSKKYRENKIGRYEVFYNEILKIKSDKNFIKLFFYGKTNDDILKLQNLFTSFFLDNFDNRLQNLVVLRDIGSEVKINQDLFYTESSKSTSPLLFSNIPFIILSCLVYLFLIISINFFLFFFKK